MIYRNLHTIPRLKCSKLYYNNELKDDVDDFDSHNFFFILEK